MLRQWVRISWLIVLAATSLAGVRAADSIKTAEGFVASRITTPGSVQAFNSSDSGELWVLVNERGRASLVPLHGDKGRPFRSRELPVGETDFVFKGEIAHLAG